MTTVTPEFGATMLMSGARAATAAAGTAWRFGDSLAGAWVIGRLVTVLTTADVADDRAMVTALGRVAMMGVWTVV
jgi:hypothetical protein